MGLIDLPRGVWRVIDIFDVQNKRQTEALENIALELEKLRILKEREAGLRVRETESGDILVEEGEY
jgi:hypothetical protein